MTSGNSVAPTHKSFGRAHALRGYTYIIIIVLYTYYMCFVHTEYNIVYAYESYIGRTARNLRRTTYSIVVAMGRSPCNSVRVTRINVNYIVIYR